MTFWHAIAAGADRLTPAEDQLVWDMRAIGHGFDAIAAEIKRRRAAYAERRAAMRAAMMKRHAIRWREQYRQEKRT